MAFIPIHPAANYLAAVSINDTFLTNFNFYFIPCVHYYYEAPVASHYFHHSLILIITAQSSLQFFSVIYLPGFDTIFPLLRLFQIKFYPVYKIQ